MLWEIQTTPPSYLFGTYHTKDPLFVPPKIVFEKLKKSQRLYTEIILTPQMYEKINHAASLSNPVELQHRVGMGTIKKIEQYLYDINSTLSIDDFSSLHLWAVGMVLSNEPENIAYKENLFMDEILVAKAKEYAIQTGALEDYTEQLAFLQELNATQQENLLHYIIDSFAFKEIVQEWYKSGNPSGFVALEKMVSEAYYALMEPIRFVRNETFARRIDILLQSTPKRSYFFAIGAGHLGEADGIIVKLRQKGYRLKKVQ